MNSLPAQRPFGKTETAVALIALALLVVRAAELLAVTSDHSLWGDEIVSVRMFSGQGLGVCLSDYTIPNNHVLFNAINSVLPGAGSYDPLRARIVSYVAVSLGLVVALASLIPGRRWIVLLAFGLAYLGDDRLLEVHYGARGYGMLALAATLVCLLVSSHLETDKSGPWRLWALAGSVLLGALTVPTFLFFGGSVLLSLFCLRRTRRHFIAGFVVFVIAAGYWAWMYVSNHGFGEAPAGFFEGEFHELSAPLTLVGLFALEGWPDALRYLAIALVLAAPWLVPHGGPRRTVALCLWFGILGSLAICLVLKRPLFHTVAHLMVPGGFLAGLTLEGLATRWLPKWRAASLALVVLVAVACTAAALRPRDPLRLWPVECWRELAVVVDALAPAGGDPEIWAPFRGDSLATYLPGRVELAPEFDASAFATGRQVVISSPKTKFPDERVEPGLIADAEVSLRVRQKAGGFQLIAFRPAPGVRAEVMTVGPKPGTTSGSTFRIDLRLPPSAGSDDILYLFSSRPIMAKPPVVRVIQDPAPQGDGDRDLGKKLEVVAVAGLWAVELPDDVDPALPLEVIYYAAEPGDRPPGFVAWLGSKIPAESVRTLLF